MWMLHYVDHLNAIGMPFYLECIISVESQGKRLSAALAMECCSLMLQSIVQGLCHL